MISVAFVNGEYTDLLVSDPALKLERELDTILCCVNETISNYMERVEQVTFESEMNGIPEEEFQVALEADGKKIVDSIGNMVISIFNKVIEFIKNTIEKITNIGFKNKSDTAKLEKLIKEHPDLKDNIIAHREDFQLSDMRSLKELDAAYDEIIRMCKQKNVDPKSLKGKMEAFKKKCENVDKSAAIKVVGATASVVALGSAILLYKKNCVEAKKSADEGKTLCMAKKQKVADAMEALQKMDPKFDPNNMTKRQILTASSRYYTGAIEEALHHNETALSKLQNKFDNVLSKFESKKSTENFKANLNNAKTVKRADDEKASEKLRKDEMTKVQARIDVEDMPDNRKKLASGAKLKAVAQLDGQTKYKGTDKTLTELKRQARELASSQQEGQINAKHDLEDEIKRQAKVLAKSQQEGKNEAQPVKGESSREKGKQEQLGKFDAIDERNKKKKK